MGDNGTIVCPFKLNPVKNIDYWKPIVLQVQASYPISKGSTMVTEAYDYVYWNQTFFPAANLLPAEGTTTGFKNARPQSGFFPQFSDSYLIAPTTSGYAQVPNEYRTMYGVPNAEPSVVHKDLAMGVLEFPGGGGAFGSGYNKTDLKLFMEITKNTRYNEDLVQYVGLNASLGAGGESQLDIQMICGVAPAVPAVFWGSSTRRPTSARS